MSEMPDAASGGPLHILLVDDEPDIEPLVRQRLRRQVRSGDYVLHFAGDGVEALESLAADRRIDLVVTDINMPRMDGLTLLEHIPGVDLDIKAVVVSAYGDMPNIRTAMNRGAFDFVTKPLDFEDFEVTLERARRHIVRWKAAQASRDRLSALERELDLASRMQQGILPVEFPCTDTFSVHGSMWPAKTIGGDFFDVLCLEHGCVGLAVADVSDKGIPAALFMMSSRTMLKGAAIGHHRPEKVLEEVNDLLHADNRQLMFTTLVYAVYHPESGALGYANAGHCHPFVVDARGAVRVLGGTNGVALGLSPGLVYRGVDTTLAPGDTLFMYSDGISEALDGEGAEFGAERLEAALGAVAPRSAAHAAEMVLAALSRFTGATEQTDDITCLVLHRRCL